MLRSALRMASVVSYSFATMILVCMLIVGAAKIASASAILPSCSTPIYVLLNPCSNGLKNCPSWEVCDLYTIDLPGGGTTGICLCNYTGPVPFSSQ